MKSIKVRHEWKFNPITRVVKSKKKYNRKKAKQAFKKELDNF